MASLVALDNIGLGSRVVEPGPLGVAFVVSPQELGTMRRDGMSMLVKYGREIRSSFSLNSGGFTQVGTECYDREIHPQTRWAIDDQNEMEWYLLFLYVIG